MIQTATQPPALPQPGDRCLSIRQPWVYLILRNFKRYENRSRATKFRGRLWLHASRSLGLRDWSEIVGGAPVPLSEGVTLGDGTELPALDSLEQGVILGSVEIFDCKAFSEMPKKEQRDPFAEGPHVWYLRDPRLLASPVAASGALGIWTWK